MFDFSINEKLKNIPSCWFLEGFTRLLEHEPALREGYARYHLYTNIPIYINPMELIVGNLDWAISKEVVINSVGNQEINNCNLEEFLKCENITDIKKKIAQKQIELIKPYVLNNIEDTLTQAEKKVSLSSAGTSNHYNGHMVLDYSQILSEGLGGYVNKVINFRDGSKTKKDYDFYDGMLYTLKGIQIYILKHSLMADYLLEYKQEDYNELQLKEIKQNCKNIINNPPKTFLEALQLVWFMFSFGDYDSFGRFDQYMYSFYENDLAIYGKEKLDEYLKFFFNKAEQNRCILNMTIGGTNCDGSSSVNELTYAVLRVVRELGFKSPNLCIRLTDESEHNIYLEVHKNLSKGQGIPALYNDKLIIPMLEAIGIEKEDAYDYSLAGCSQVIIPSKSNFCCDVGLYNALKILELTLHNGFDKRMNEFVGIKTGEVTDFADFDSIYKAYIKQMKYIIQTGVSINNKDIIARKDIPSNVRTLFTQGCLESGKAIFEGGAKYNAVQSEIIGLTNVANSLYTIKKLVYEQKKLTLKELVGILDSNYENKETFRQTILSIDKFGNDIEEVDQLRADISTEFYNELSKYGGAIGGKHWGGEVAFMSHIQFAPYTLASADGRKDFQPLADSGGAMQGTDINGPTALIKSMSKIPFAHPTICRTLNLKFDKEMFKKSAEQIIALWRTFFQLNGCQMQVNVQTHKDLLNAQKNPEDYGGLVVRIGGYNDYFVEISKEMQDEVISRTEQVF